MNKNMKLRIVIILIMTSVCFFGIIYFSLMNKMNRGLYSNYDTIVDDAVYVYYSFDDTQEYISKNNIQAAYYEQEFYKVDENLNCRVFVINKEAQKYGIPVIQDIFISIKNIDLVPNKVYMSDMSWNIYKDDNIVNIGDVKYKDGMETKKKSVGIAFVYIPDYSFDNPEKIIYSSQGLSLPEDVVTNAKDLYYFDTITTCTGNVIKTVHANSNHNVFVIWRSIFIASEILTIFAITPILSYYMASIYKSSWIKRIFFMKKRAFINETFASLSIVILLNFIGSLIVPLIVSQMIDREAIIYSIVSTIILICEMYLVLSISTRTIYSKNLNKLKFGENI